MWINSLTCVAGQVLRPYWGGLRLVGATGAIPMRGPLLIASNHASFLDPWFISIAFPRGVHYLITRDWYDKSPLYRWFFRGNGTIPVDARSVIGTIESVCALLALGKVAGIFPEGGISSDGLIQPFRPGLSRIAAKSGAPVLPVGLRGNFATLPRHRRLPRPACVTVHVGSPVRFPGSPIDGPPPRGASHQFHEHILREVCRLAGQEDRLPTLLAQRRRTASPNIV